MRDISVACRAAGDPTQGRRPRHEGREASKIFGASRRNYQTTNVCLASVGRHLVWKDSQVVLQFGFVSGWGAPLGPRRLLSKLAADPNEQESMRPVRAPGCCFNRCRCRVAPCRCKQRNRFFRCWCINFFLHIAFRMASLSLCCFRHHRFLEHKTKLLTQTHAVRKGCRGSAMAR